MNEKQKDYLLKSVWANALALGPDVAPDRPEAEQVARAVAYILARLLKKPVVVSAVARWALEQLQAEPEQAAAP